MLKYFVVLLILAVAANAVSFYNVVQEEWEVFKLRYNKTYNSTLEERFRFKIFTDNKLKIASHNQKFVRGEVDFELAENQFSDMLHSEFVSTMNGFKMPDPSKSGRRSATFVGPPDDVILPDSIDWREKGAVTVVKYQGMCGSCWAFAATGSLEGQHFRKTGKLVSLSEQNLVDCSIMEGNRGCQGGSADRAYEYIDNNGGIDTEKAYPYTGEADLCSFNPAAIGATEVSYTDLEKGSEEKLKVAVAVVGPISVAIDASHDSLFHYKSGIYYEPSCSSTYLDHGVLVVGYGTENGKDYWIVKNSWSQAWGDRGYVKMARNRGNNCGIASMASYPVV